MGQFLISARLFEESDLRDLYAIEQVCFAPPLRFSPKLIRDLAFSPYSRSWVGFFDGVRAGFAIVSLAGEPDPSSGYIWTIEVLPEYRRRGVARLLMECMEESAREAGCSAIELHVSARNSGGAALYEHSGYVRVGIERAYYGRGEDGLQYRKMLGESDTRTAETD